MRCQIIKRKVVNPCLGLCDIPTGASRIPIPNKSSFNRALELGASKDPLPDPSLSSSRRDLVQLKGAAWTRRPNPFSSTWERATSNAKSIRNGYMGPNSTLNPSLGEGKPPGGDKVSSNPSGMS